MTKKTAIETVEPTVETAVEPVGEFAPSYVTALTTTDRVYVISGDESVLTTAFQMRVLSLPELREIGEHSFEGQQVTTKSL